MPSPTNTPACLTPNIGLLTKLGSIAQHIKEGASSKGHAFDIEAAKALVADPEVALWLSEMDKLALIPKVR